MLISPGVTKQSVASMTREATGSLPASPTPETNPFVIATQPPEISLRSSSTVATKVALRMSKSVVDVNEFATLVTRFGVLMKEETN